MPSRCLHVGLWPTSLLKKLSNLQCTKSFWNYLTNSYVLNFVQAPDRFVVAAVRNPVCNLSLMLGTTDIPDWCYVEAFGSEGKNYFSEAPSAEYLSLLYNKSPISHLPKVWPYQSSCFLVNFYNQRCNRFLYLTSG